MLTLEIGTGAAAEPVGQFPVGFDEWLVEFIHHVNRGTAFLRQNGADAQANARDAVIRELLHRGGEHFDAEIGVEEAAAILGRDAETVRRAVRKGSLPDRRDNPRGHHRLRRGDVLSLDSKGQKTYDSAADAQDIAKRRKGAA